MASGSPAVQVQRGFHLPAPPSPSSSNINLANSAGASSFGINPAMLSGIPEVATEESNSSTTTTNDRESSTSRSRSDRRKREASPGTSASEKPTHFVIPHIKNSNSYAHSHSRSYSQSWADGLQNLHLAKNNGDDFADALLQSFINTDPTPTGSNASNNTADLQFHHSPHVPLSPTAPIPLTFDIGRPNLGNFHGYQPSTSINSTASGNANSGSNSKMAYSLPPEFLRHHSAPGAPFGNTLPDPSIDILHSPSSGAGSAFDGNSLFLNLGLAQYPASNSSSAAKSHNDSRPGSVKMMPSPDEVASGGSGSGPPSVTGRNNTASPAQQDDIMLVATVAANAKQQQQLQQQQQSPARGRAATTGKAPSARQSRSRQRAPSYARTVSPAGLKSSAITSSAAATTASTSTTQSSSTLSASTTGKSQTVTSPYVTGYPSPSVNVQVNIGGRYGVSLPTYSAVGNTWGLGTNGSAFGSTSNNVTSNNNSGFGFANPFGSSSGHQRRQSDASTFVPSSFGESPLLHMNNTALPLLEENDDGGKTNNILDTPATIATSLDSVAPKLFGHRKGASASEPVSGVFGSTKAEVKKPSPSIEEEDEKPRVPEDKRRKRRESHNAVERRRRDNINERITELASLIPQVLLDPTGSSSSALEASPILGKEGSPSMLCNEFLAGSPPLGSSTSAFTPAQIAQQQANSRPNKGVILSKSVEYIRYLQQMVQIQMERNKVLEGRLKEAGSTSSSDSQIPKQSQSKQSTYGSNNVNNVHDDLSYGLATVDEMFMDEDMRDNLQRDTLSFEDYLGVQTETPGAMTNGFDEDMS